LCLRRFAAKTIVGLLFISFMFFLRIFNDLAFRIFESKKTYGVCRFFGDY